MSNFFGHGTRRRVEITSMVDRPKDADVINWNRLLVAELCPGPQNDDLRGYLKATTEKAWQLVNWLTHHRNANKTAALIASDAIDAIVKHYLRLLSRERADRADQCPRCASRNIRNFFDIAIGPDGAYSTNALPAVGIAIPVIWTTILRN